MRIEGVLQCVCFGELIVVGVYFGVGYGVPITRFFPNKYLSH